MAHATPRNLGQKLRTACDRCQASKVKCSREKPSCWRCSQGGLACIYSPLRRTGRPPRRTSTSTHTGESVKGTSSIVSNAKDVIHQQNKNAETPTNQERMQRQDQDNGLYTSWSKPSLGGLESPTAPMDTMDTDITQDGSKQWETGPTQSQTNPVDSLIQDLMLNLDTCGFTMGDISPEFDLNLGGSTLIPNTPELDTNDASTIHVAQPTSSITRTGSANDRKRFEGNNWDIPNHSSATSTVFSRAPSVVGESGHNSRLSLANANTSEPTNRVPSDTVFKFSSFFPPHHASTTVAPSASGTPSTNVGPGKSTQPCRYGGTCYKALSNMLARLVECDSDTDGQDGISLDTLLCLDRELQETARRTLECRYCMERPSNQNMLMIVYMSLDNLLQQFEKQQRQQRAQLGQDDSISGKKTLVLEQHRQWLQILPMAEARHTGVAGPTPNSRQEQQDGPKTVHHSPQFPWTDKSLMVGNFATDNAVKAEFLRYLVLSYVENVLKMLSELEKEAGAIMKGVNCTIVKDKAIDIHRRAFFLRGRLRLDAIGI
ncbi:uncharacterized protein F4822DRAFT_46452 [Hypoxylon trugodes]|uniref:uncharacterized protein n=1 Tax=Hypoxylon trugodes TaxID=326681 RepID=UPI00219CA081|nr:uncharacterized protein F4822DRAFT_46452 [Hypoxylon trugodes]KAI1394381.1 hypothetical protein F4822DRAFT_46452 [Hypoxylon trugodes]